MGRRTPAFRALEQGIQGGAGGGRLSAGGRGSIRERRAFSARVSILVIEVLRLEITEVVQHYWFTEPFSTSPIKCWKLAAGVPGAAKVLGG